MSYLNIETGLKNNVLRTVSKKIPIINKNIKKLARNMEETLIAENGLGLAAPQVGGNVRMILVLMDFQKPTEKIMVMVNPEITHFSKEQVSAEEGCLSLPEQFDFVMRSKDIMLKYQNLNGKEISLKFSDLNARIIQHEIDHLDGVLFLDKIDSEYHKNNNQPHLAL